MSLWAHTTEQKRVSTGLPSPVCVVCCETVMAVSVNNTSFTKVEILIGLLKLKKIKLKLLQLLPCYLHLFFCVILAICASRERYFRNNGWTRPKVEKREQGLQLGNPRITHPVEHWDQKIVFSRFAHTKIHDPRRNSLSATFRLNSIRFGRGLTFKFKPKLSNTTVNLLSPYDLRDKPNQRNSKNVFFR